ncbi:DMT family transporter [Hyphomonas sp.]|uniref:DMT family transporter n=1 Tax=Hyphomonas sp. TaxID=87 RepID=UPI000A649DED|nr:DMT family transporter [Hyphomonas sp.]MBA4338995.1 EamA family transporter [Hyphomonas sp.]
MTNAVPQPRPVLQPRPWLGPLMVLGGGIALGFAPIGLRLGLDELGPQAIAFWRYLFAVPMLLVLVLAVDRRLPAKPNIAVFLAALFFTLDMALWHWALTMTSVSNATFIVNLGNVLVGLAAWAFLKERPGLNWAFAAGLAILGAAALSLGGDGSHPGALRGDLFALAAAVFVSFYMLFSKLARRTLGGLEAMFWLSVFESALAFFVVLFSGEDFMPKTPAGFLVPLALAIVVQVAGQGLIISGLGSTDTAVAGILVLAQPVVAAAISWSLFKEPLTTIQAAGAAAILVAVWLAQQKQRTRPLPAP